MKKVVYIVIDALATRVVEPAIRDGRLPNLAALVAAGVMRSDCISIFPSITPAATCTLTTGCYPCQHGIAGAHWYDAQRDEVAYFGSDLLAIIEEGVGRYLRDFQKELNLQRLQVPTIFERIEQHGRLRDAVINMLWFRGTVEHEISYPPLLKLMPGTDITTLPGPHLMFMGDFFNTPLDRTGRTLSARGGIKRRYGFHDENTADYLLHLAEEYSLPEFTLAYFPNNDFESHKRGPQAAIDVLQAVDEHLGQLFEVHGGLAAILDQFAILITGDHSQSDLDSAESAAVDLNDVLAEFKLVKAGGKWQSDDDVMVCPNMRAAQIYLRAESWRGRQQVVDCLLGCEDVDQVIWCETEDGLDATRDVGFNVATKDRGALAFRPAGDNDALGTDPFGGRWRWEGDLNSLDAKVGSDRELVFGDYPNAFERIATSFFRQSGNIWVTARLGREFCLPKIGCHSSGSHGSLHALDSTSPLIAAGLPETIELPDPVRSVDVVPLCLMLLDLPPERPPGASHIDGYPSRARS